MAATSRRSERATPSVLAVLLAATLVGSVPAAAAAPGDAGDQARVVQRVATDQLQPVAQDAQDEPPGPDEPDRGRATLLILIAVVIGAIAGGAIGVWTLKRRGEGPSDGKNSDPGETDDP